MCGIVGIWGDVDKSKIQSMIDTLLHRGPDGHGMHVQLNQGMLGHIRLAIMDPDHGQQPINNEDHSATLVANGMVYNHPQLRKQLGEAHNFISHSDSETILHIYEEHGLSTPQLLDGMFAGIVPIMRGPAVFF